jgi:hypothetical protein
MYITVIIMHSLYVVTSSFTLHVVFHFIALTSKLTYEHQQLERKHLGHYKIKCLYLIYLQII